MKKRQIVNEREHTKIDLLDVTYDLAMANLRKLIDEKKINQLRNKKMDWNRFFFSLNIFSSVLSRSSFEKLWQRNIMSNEIYILRDLTRYLSMIAIKWHWHEFMDFLLYYDQFGCIDLLCTVDRLSHLTEEKIKRLMFWCKNEFLCILIYF